MIFCSPSVQFLSSNNRICSAPIPLHSPNKRFQKSQTSAYKTISAGSVQRPYNFVFFSFYSISLGTKRDKEEARLQYLKVPIDLDAGLGKDDFTIRAVQNWFFQYFILSKRTLQVSAYTCSRLMATTFSNMCTNRNASVVGIQF